MKAILVIDMPNEVEAEDYCMMYGLFANKGEKPFALGEIAFECKNIDLRPLPKRNEYRADTKYENMDKYSTGYADGYNACLSEILGETE